MKALVGALNQEKGLVGAFSVIVKTDCDTDGALHSTNNDGVPSAAARLIRHLIAIIVLKQSNLKWICRD